MASVPLKKINRMTEKPQPRWLKWNIRVPVNFWSALLVLSFCLFCPYVVHAGPQPYRWIRIYCVFDNSLHVPPYSSDKIRKNADFVISLKNGDAIDFWISIEKSSLSTDDVPTLNNSAPVIAVIDLYGRTESEFEGHHDTLYLNKDNLYSESDHICLSSHPLIDRLLALTGGKLQ